MRSKILPFCWGVMMGLSPTVAVAQSSLFGPLPLEPTADTAPPAGDVTGAETEELVVSQTDRYTVQMPIVPQTDTHTTAIRGGTLVWTVSTARQEGELYAIAYTDLPLDALELGREDILESLQTRPFFSDFDWQAIAQSGHRIFLHDLPGIEYLYVDQGRFSALRLYLANRRLYLVMASSSDLSKVDQFINSFEIASIWRPFESAAGRFSVSVPMAPVTSSQVTDYRGNRLNWQQFTVYNLMAPDDAYQIAYVDLPASAAAREPAILFDEIADLVLTPLEAAAIAASGQPISLQGHPGREYATTISSGKSYVLRFYLVEERLYGVLSGSQSLNNHAQFLNSFQLQE